jgi:hypothetical protein
MRSSVSNATMNTVEAGGGGKILDGVKKKKKSTHLEILSVLNSKPLLVAAPAPAASFSKGLHSNAARWNESLLPKNFIVKKKKKKGLSTFKKKILMVGFSIVKVFCSCSNVGRRPM